MQLVLFVSVKHLLGWIPSLTKPSSIFDTSSPTKLFLHESSLLASIFVPGNSLTEGKRVPSASTPVPELESTVSER